MSIQLSEARAYVDRMRARGKTDAQIATKLRGAGWDDSSLELVLHNGTVRPETSKAVAQGWIDWCSDHEAAMAGEGLYSPSGEFYLYHTSASDFEQYLLVLSRRGQVQWEANIGPNQALEGAVTDAGFAAASIQAGIGEGLVGDLRVFAPTGELILRERPPAHLRSCGLSGDAVVAWCVTAQNPDNKAYSDKLIVFLLNPPKQLFRVEGPYGEIDDIRLAGSEVVVRSTVDGDLDYRYSLTGKLLNEEEVAEKEDRARLAAAMREGDGYTLLQAAEKRLDGTPPLAMTPEERDSVAKLLERIDQCGVVGKTKAIAFRHLADIALASGDKAKVASYSRKADARMDLAVRVALRDGDGYALLDFAEQRLKDTAFDKMAQEEQTLVCRLLERACECRVSDNTLAKVNRHLGEIALACGEKQQAVSCFRRALQLNPKVGVKKKLQALEKGLSGGGE